MQMALNDDGEYQSGRLTLVTSKDFASPTRPCGSITVHDSTILHGVTRLEAGVRYGLYRADGAVTCGYPCLQSVGYSKHLAVAASARQSSGA